MKNEVNNKYKPPEDIKREGNTRAFYEGAQRKGTQETRYLRRKSLWYWKGPGHRLRSVGEGGGLIKLVQKDGTNKVSTVGVNRDVVTLRVTKG